MSTTVDERVVEMRFDNDQFESNVNESMSTLAKLKQGLKLNGASKGLEAVNTAAKRVNFTPIVNGMNDVTTRFSHAQMTIQHQIDRWADKIVGAAERAIKSLTVEPVSDGWKEYEMTLNAVQTTMAATGKTSKEVEAELKKLDEYADKTVYGTADMLNNLPKFTNAGIELDKATTAMIGIANATALAGGDAGKASIAFYNLGQAIGTGYLTRMDYNSINNAGIATMEWKEQMVEAAIAQGTLTKVGEDAYKAGNKTLTLQQLFIDGLQEQWATTDVMMKVFGDYGDETTEIGKKAYSSAQDIKTFTMMMESLKATAGTGWKDTWQIVFGGLEEAKEFWTGLSDAISNVITRMAYYRNKILDKALNNPFADAWESIKNVTGSIGEAVKTVQNYNEIVDEIIGGKWGTGQARWDKLAESGYDWAHAQNLVNEKLGSAVRHATNYKEAQKGVNEVQKYSIEQLAEMSDAKLKDMNYSEKQIKALRYLKEQSDKTGISMKSLLEDPSQISGRTLLINSFKNAGLALVEVFKSMKTAWNEVFHGEGATSDDIINKRAMQIYDLIAAIHKLSTYLEVDSDKADKLRRTFKGLFALIDIITTLVGGGFKIAFKLVKSILGYFNLDILDLTANIGDVLVGFRDWIDSVLDFDSVVGKVIPMLVTGAKAIKGWVEAFINLPFVQNIISKIKDGFLSLKELDFKQIGNFIIEGLKNGLGSGLDVIKRIGEIAVNMIRTFCEKFKIHSPSKVMFDIGVYIFQGLINGITYMVKFVINTIKGIGTTIVNFFKALDFSGLTSTFEPAINKFKEIFNGLKKFVSRIDFEKILAVIPIAATLYLGKKILDFMGGITDALKGFGSFMESFAGVGEQINKTLKAAKWKVLASALKDMAIAVAIIVGSVIALTILVDNPKELIWAVTTVTILMAAMAGLAYAISKMSDSSATIEKGKIQIDGVKSSLISIAGAIVLLAATAKVMGGMSTREYIQGMLGVITLMGLMILFVWACGKVGDNKTGYVVGKLGNTLLKLSGAMLLLILVCKLVSKLEPSEIKNGLSFMAIFFGLVGVLSLITQMTGEHVDKLGGMLLKMSLAMILMIAVCKLAARLSPEEMIAGVKFAGGFLAFVALLMLVNKIGKDDEMAKIGLLLLSISGAMILMVLVCKLVAKLEAREILAGIITMGVFLIFVGILTKITTLDKGKESAKLAGTLIAIAAAIAILAAIAVLLGMVPLPMLAKGVGAVVLLGTIMTTMIWACRGANSVVGNLIVMTVAIGIMALAVWKLSSINWKGLAAATISLGVLMAMFMNLIETGKHASGAIAPLIVMTVVVAMLGTVLYMLGRLPVESVLGSAIGLSVLLLAFAAALKILSTVLIVSKSALVAMGVMTLITLALGIILYSLKDLPIESTLNTAIALSVLILALSSACILIGAAGTLAPFAYAGITALIALIVAMGALITTIGYLVTEFPKLEEFLNTGIPILEKIGYAIGSFVGNIITGFGEAVMGLLPAFGESLSLFMDKASGFINEVSALDESVILGTTYLTGAILELSAASFISGITTLGGIGLVALGENLTAFAEASKPFFEAVKSIGPEGAIGAKNLAEAILVITVADLIEGIKRFLGGGDNSLTKFAEQIVPFGDAMVAFSSTVTGKIDEGAVVAAANAGKAIAEMQKELYGAGGLKQDIFGEKDLRTFGAQLLAFGMAIANFSSAVKGKIDEAAVTAAANAGKAIASLQNELYGAGGLKQDIFGEKDLKTFGTQLMAFGSAIVGFSAKVKGNIDEDAIEAASNAGKAIVGLQKELYGAGGLKQDIFGEKDLKTFGAQLVAFGSAIVGFSAKVKGNISEEAVTAAANAGTMMTELQNNIPAKGWFDGKVDLEEFGGTIVKYGEKMVAYSDKVSAMNTEAVSKSLSATLTLVDIANALQTINGESTLLNLVPISDIATKLKDFSDKIASVDVVKVGSAVDIVTRLKNVIINLSGIDTSGVGKFKSAIQTLSETNFKDVTTAFEGSAETLANIGTNIVKFITNGMESEQGKFNSAANNIVKGLSTAITSKEDTFSSAGGILIGKFIKAFSDGEVAATSTISGMMTACLASVKNRIPAFTTAGGQLVDGFANGISANSYKAAAQAKAMAEAATKAAREALGIASPSKVFNKIGDFTGQGFVNGLREYAHKAYTTASDMGNSAKSGLNDALSKAYDIINGNLETQPTIRPVLDLSSVEAGATRMNGLLNGVSNVGVISNMNAIGSMMEQRRQNGSNADVVSAIDKLRNKMDNFGNTTYQVGNVTAEEGSGVATAVESLVGAIRREGRA